MIPPVLTDSYIRKSLNDSGLIEIVGQKAIGLASMPQEWTPPFFVISTSYSKKVLHADEDAMVIFNDSVWPLIDSLIKRSPHTCNTLFLRSSSVHETLAQRGALSSDKTSIDRDSICASVFEVIRKNAHNSPCQGIGIAIVVQPFLQATQTGHLANERRVSRNFNNWLTESHDEDGPRSSRLTTKKRVEHTMNTALSARNSEELQTALRDVASFYSQPSQRYHFEWVWCDGRVWIVQRDVEEKKQCAAPGSLWRKRRRATSPVATEVLRQPDQSRLKWAKTECVTTFASCGLPYGEILVLDSTDVITALAEGRKCTALEKDLKLLCSTPIVIRTDVVTDNAENALLLPRTDCVKSPDQALEFLERTATELRSHPNLADADHCFLFHRYIWASCSAQAIAWPDQSRVLIASSWGLPEGLNYFPHDTFIYDHNTGNHKKMLRGKTHYLDVDENGLWIEREAGWDFDWKQSLLAEQIRDIASMTKKLADHLRVPIDVMYFVNVATESGYPPILPWYYTSECIPNIRAEEAQYRYVGGHHIVRRKQDIENLERALRSNHQRISVRLQPSEDMVRDSRFLNRVIDVCGEFELPVEIEGSVLSHAYYVLQHAGLHVRCVDPPFDEPPGRSFGKLVRDLIPVIIKKHGEKARIARIPQVALLRALKKKCIEEALELVFADSQEELLEELADLFEVLKSLSESCGVTLEDVDQLAAQKREERGGFSEGFYLVETTESPLVGSVTGRKELFDSDTDTMSAGTIEVVSYSLISTSAVTHNKNGVSIPVIELLAENKSEDTIVDIPDDATLARVIFQGQVIRIVFEDKPSAPKNVGQLELPLQ